MPAIQVSVQRFSVVSRIPFESVVAKFGAEIGHPDMNAFARDVTAAKTHAELELVIHKAIGASGLMEFTRFNMGEILRKEGGAETPRILRLVIGNPLIMKEMAKHVPDAGSYAPVTILVYERPDGMHLAYDRMAGLLAPYGNPDALAVARDLDSKIEGLLRESAA